MKGAPPMLHTLKDLITWIYILLNDPTITP